MKMLDILACPRSDAPLESTTDGLYCAASSVVYPYLDGIPWLFAEPQSSLDDWRGRMHHAIQSVARDSASVERELKDKKLSKLARRRLEHFLLANRAHAEKLTALAAPLTELEFQGDYATYLAMRTRLPTDQGLNTYYANLHRDWCWGEEENAASLEQIRQVVDDDGELGRTLVLGAGAGRLAYDVARSFGVRELVVLDFNPMLMLAARRLFAGETLELYEFPIAPVSGDASAVLRELSAPEAFQADVLFVLGDALRAPFKAGSFDTVLTPWLIDILPEDLATFSRRLNAWLKDGGRWLNFGSLAFDGPRRAGHIDTAEVAEIVGEAGFDAPRVHEAQIPYMCSPASRHGRVEKVFSFAARKHKTVKAPPRHRSLPDWIVTGKAPVPLSNSFRTQTMTTRIYAFIMSLIDGRRSIEDMAKVMEQQQLMKRDEAVAAIRNFLTRMYDDAQREKRL